MEPQMLTADIQTGKFATEEQVAIVKSAFEQELSKALNLTKVAAPMVVLQGTGVNDDLSGVERAVKFPIKGMQDRPAEVVQSLAKWKRLRLRDYGVQPGTGILTDMKALRPDEDFTAIHSIFVDQWDWELSMPEDRRDLLFLKQTVTAIYAAIKAAEKRLAVEYPQCFGILPEELTFLHAEELLAKYPGLSPKQREDTAAKEYGAIFLIGIGGKLSHGEPHDGRAPDYDDWSTPNEEGFIGLNGDLIVWNEVLGRAFEISSMGIRVNAESLQRQLSISGKQEREALYYHRELLAGSLPQCIGGGIGQSRLCMFLLKKRHIGEVQVGIWPEEVREKCEQEGIFLL